MAKHYDAIVIGAGPCGLAAATMPAHAGLCKSGREHDYVHACVSSSLEDLRIRI